MHAAISFDLVDECDGDFEEGTYRLPGAEWRVFIFTKNDVGEPRIKEAKWAGGVVGLHIDYPRSAVLNHAAVVSVLSVALGVSEFTTVRGPDSMVLR